MKKRSFAIIAAVAAVALALMSAACGDEEQGIDEAIDKAVQQAEDQLGESGDTIDACAILTSEDASDLFGAEAKQDESTAPLVLGECIWSNETETGSQLLQMQIYSGEQFYSEDEGAETFDIGDKGNIKVDAFSGIDIQWVQDGKTVALSYFNLGEGVPEVQSKVEEMKALALKVSDEL